MQQEQVEEEEEQEEEYFLAGTISFRLDFTENASQRYS